LGNNVIVCKKYSQGKIYKLHTLFIYCQLGQKQTKMTNNLCRRCFLNDMYISPRGDKKYYCLECNKIFCKKWYKKNRDKKIKFVKNYQKTTNYFSEKTEKQRKIRNIKRETRRKYPLLNQSCEFCKKKATEHHHNTIPIKIDKFNYLCHECHIYQNELIKGG